MNDARRPDRRALPPHGEVTQYELDRPAASGLYVPSVHRSTARTETHLWEHWRILLRHRWLVIAFLFITVAATAAWTFTARPLFTATVTLRIEKEEPRVVKFEDVLKADTTEDYYQTQYQILKSRSLATSVIAALRLDQHPEFQDRDRGFLSTIRQWIQQRLQQLTPEVPPVERAATDELGIVSPVTDFFLTRLAIEPVRNSRLVRVAFESYYPDIAARVANTLADTFIAQQLRQKTEATRYATDFLGQQLDGAGRKLEQAETQLQRFLEANNIFFLTADKAGEQQDLITQQLTHLSDALLKVRADRIAKESLYAQAVGHDANSVPAVLASPVVARLKEELAKSDAEYRRLGQLFKPEYPRMEQLQRSIAELRQHLAQEGVRILDGLDADYRAAVLAERQLEKTMDNHQQLARKLGAKMPQYSVLRRDVDTNRQVYISLLTRLKETQVSSALITSNIYPVDRGEIPISPSKPRKTLNLMLGLVVGLFGGVALAFLVEYLDTTVKDANDIRGVLRVPALGFVPVLRVPLLGFVTRAARMDERVRVGRAMARNAGGGGRLALATGSEVDPVFAEAFRTLRTTLLYCSSENVPTTLMVTSPQRGEGKTTIASNLAIALAQHGAGDVLIIDADLRRPILHKVFGARRAPGFANFLAGEVELPEVILSTVTSNLYIVPAGRTSSTLADLLASPRLGPALEVLSGRFKHIVFDTTPLFGISDALSLAPHVGGVLLVLRHGHAHRETARHAVELLATVGTPFLGVVLNRFNPKTAGAGYYEYPGYGFQYADSDDSPGRRGTRRGEHRMGSRGTAAARSDA